jgi:hypothetical protein
MSTTEYDAGLFETISALISEHLTENRQNRRSNPRHPYECVQLLAPFDGTELPGLDELRPVLCHDLSRCGFSFLSYERPKTNLVIAALGRIPPKFFVAEILHVHPTHTSDDHEYQVGCRFIRRLEDAR